MPSGVLLSLCRNLHYSKHWCPVNTHSLMLKWQLMVICQQLFTSVILFQHTGFGVLVFFFFKLATPSVLWMTRLSSGWLLTSFSHFFVSLSLASLSCCQCTSNVRASLQLCPRSPLMKLTILTDTRWDGKPQTESVTGANWQGVQFWHSEHNSTHKPKLHSDAALHFTGF